MDRSLCTPEAGESTDYPNEVEFSPLEFSGSGPLGSVLTVAEAYVGLQVVGDVDIHVFWKGLDSKLWEAYYSAHTGNCVTCQEGIGPRVLSERNTTLRNFARFL